MLKFPYSIRAYFWIFLLPVFALALPGAYGQADFSLQATTPSPSAVDPGVNSTAEITLGSSVNGFDTPVSFSCSVAPAQTKNPCTISPSTATAPATISVTFSSSGLAPTQYTLTVTGSAAGQTVSVTLDPITVLAVAPTYALTVGTTLSPSTVSAGTGATAVIDLASTDGYSGTVTMGCSSITPLVEPSPVCSFNPEPVVISNGATATTTLTVNTAGVTSSGTKVTASAARARTRMFLALLVPLPFAVIAGFGSAAKRRRKLLSLFFLFLIAAGLVTLPSCSSSTTVNNGTTTPSNTYTFTITGYDQNGVAPNNTSAVTVSLTVN
jgi:hypothetical protein